MHLPHSKTPKPDESPTQAKLWRCVLLSVVGLLVGAGLTIPLDYGRYAAEFRSRGLLGFLGMPSLLVFQFGLLVSAVVFFGLALRQGPRRGLRAMVWLLGIAAGVYCLSLWLLYTASRHGEFGIGAAATAVLFGYFPSAAFILIGLPATIFYVLRKPYA